MTTYVIINFIVTLCLILLVGYLFYKQKLNQRLISNNILRNWRIKVLIIIATIFIFTAFIAPFVFTRPSINSDFNFTATGAIGDTIGGLMNPFISISSVIVTGLAFYIQYLANIQQRELFEEEQRQNSRQLQDQIDKQKKENKLQKFESQFYEMLKLHRENITEMKIEGYHFFEDNPLKRYEKNTDGRKLFVVMKTEFECILKLYCGYSILDNVGFMKCYELFFFGIEMYENKYPKESDYIKSLREARKQHEEPTYLVLSNKDRKNYKDKKTNIQVDLYFNYKPFSGHSSRLSHYYRHLFLMVKLIVNNEDLIEYEKKMEYLRILRAQLSNHEQIFLFYNWLGGFGQRWENQENQFFTEYCMIHNLLYNELFEDNYISDKVKSLRNKPVVFRKSKMFEID